MRYIGYLNLLLLCLVATFTAEAQRYEDYFRDSTLRIDYAFAGDVRSTSIQPEELHCLPRWYGRRSHLSELPLEGNGRITMRDSITGQVIYRHSFSSLYQEWLSTPEAQRVARSYENVFLLPYPRRTAQIEIELEDMMRRTIARQSFYFEPSDILVRQHTAVAPTKHSYLHKAKHSESAIDIVILAEGYTEADMPKFLRDAERAGRELLRYAPFSDYQDYINIIAVESRSLDSGVSVPREGKWLRTAFSAHFDTFYSERYLTTRRVKAIHDALINIPYENIIILANTETYGGGGIYNSYTLSSIDPRYFLPVVVHEFGHSFGGLADEYFYEQDAMTDSYALDVEPWEQNITSLKDFSGKKWHSLIPKGTPIPTPLADKARYPLGVYEGAAYTAKGLYRASDDCRMRTNEYPTFCPACHKALDELIRFYLPEEAGKLSRLKVEIPKDKTRVRFNKRK
ncbi:MAG: M64 family metallopeptidase [Porphyromonas sp.]|nr:M64 family metallopeptidase [Porphyromonas sp.]